MDNVDKAVDKTGLELAESVAKEAVKEIEKDRSMAWILIDNAKSDAKRWFIVSMTILFLWLATIGMFLIYLYQYDFSVTTTTYETDSQDGGHAIINESGSVNVNGESKKDNND